MNKGGKGSLSILVWALLKFNFRNQVQQESYKNRNVKENRVSCLNGVKKGHLELPAVKKLSKSEYGSQTFIRYL